MADTTLPGLLATGDHAGRPSASAVGKGGLYACSTHGLIYQTDGSTWSTWATLGGTETLPATIIDAKGDIIAGTAADTASRLAVGTNGQVLTADSGEATGLKWAAAGGGGGDDLVPTLLAFASNTANTASLGVTISALASGDRIIVCVASNARDVNTPTCTNVTFSDMGGTNYSTAMYVHVFAGVATDVSGTTVTITATGSNYIEAACYSIADALTPTAGTSASDSDTDTTVLTRRALNIAPTRGTLWAAVFGQANGTTRMNIDASAPCTARHRNGGTGVSCIGYAPGGDLGVWITSGHSGADSAAFLVAIT